MATEEETYRDGVNDKLDDLKIAVKEVGSSVNLRLSLSEGQNATAFAKLDEKVSYTNGKVKKLIMAVILVFGILIGQNFTLHEIIGIFTKFV